MLDLLRPENLPHVSAHDSPCKHVPVNTQHVVAALRSQDDSIITWFSRRSADVVHDRTMLGRCRLRLIMFEDHDLLVRFNVQILLNAPFRCRCSR